MLSALRNWLRFLLFGETRAEVDFAKNLSRSTPRAPSRERALRSGGAPDRDDDEGEEEVGAGDEVGAEDDLELDLSDAVGQQDAPRRGRASRGRKRRRAKRGGRALDPNALAQRQAASLDAASEEGGEWSAEELRAAAAFKRALYGSIQRNRD